MMWVLCMNWIVVCCQESRLSLHRKLYWKYQSLSTIWPHSENKHRLFRGGSGRRNSSRTMLKMLQLCQEWFWKVHWNISREMKWLFNFLRGTSALSQSASLVELQLYKLLTKICIIGILAEFGVCNVYIRRVCYLLIIPIFRGLVPVTVLLA